MVAAFRRLRSQSTRRIISTFSTTETQSRTQSVLLQQTLTHRDGTTNPANLCLATSTIVTDSASCKMRSRWENADSADTSTLPSLATTTHHLITMPIGLSMMVNAKCLESPHIQRTFGYWK
jgi:hypothetical protein